MAVLEPYIKSGIVTLVQWEKNQAQMEAYQDAFHRFKNETQWMGFIDLDEYVIPKKRDDIKDFFETIFRIHRLCCIGVFLARRDVCIRIQTSCFASNLPFAGLSMIRLVNAS